MPSRQRSRSRGHPAEAGGSGLGQRQLRVGEELRHVLSQILREAEFRDPALRDADITVTEVRLSPDLRNATVFVMPLAGINADSILPALKRSAPFLRGLVARQMALRVAPALGFALDKSFEAAERVAALLARPEVERDLHPTATDDTDDAV